MSAHLLDRAGWNALIGPHAYLAEINGLARRYPADISPFNAVADIEDPQAWRDLRELIGEEGTAIVIGESISAPSGWEITNIFPGVQMTGEAVVGQPDSELVPLTLTDSTEMLALVARTEPGPFVSRTVELGGYLGIRIEGELVAHSLAAVAVQDDGVVQPQ